VLLRRLQSQLKLQTVLLPIRVRIWMTPIRTLLRRWKWMMRERRMNRALARLSLTMKSLQMKHQRLRPRAKLLLPPPPLPPGVISLQAKRERNRKSQIP